MFRKFLLFVIVVSLLSSAASAGIGYVQGFSIAGLNNAKTVGCYGFDQACASNSATVGQSYSAYDRCIGSASMNQGGALMQNAKAYGLGMPNEVVQNASVSGTQGQTMTGGWHGFNSQGQNLTLNLNTNAQKTSNLGGAIGSQSFAGGQSQTQTTRQGFNTSSQFVNAGQSAAILGSRGGGYSNVTVNNNLNVNMFQSSMAN